ncbi:MAG: T9SS type A sorting domain-containing protein [Bacteroidetes bacterium]|nr:T9SS type A sorting domain-containing protein [Bacteroidota bacterium]
MYYSVVDIYDNASTGINANNDNKGITINPNPTTGVININGISNLKIIVYSSFGTKVKELTGDNKSNSYRIDLSLLDAGLYCVQVLNSSGNIVSNSKVLRE